MSEETKVEDKSGRDIVKDEDTINSSMQKFGGYIVADLSGVSAGEPIITIIWEQ